MFRATSGDCRCKQELLIGWGLPAFTHGANQHSAPSSQVSWEMGGGGTTAHSTKPSTKDCPPVWKEIIGIAIKIRRLKLQLCEPMHITCTHRKTRTQKPISDIFSLSSSNNSGIVSLSRFLTILLGELLQRCVRAVVMILHRDRMRNTCNLTSGSPSLKRHTSLGNWKHKQIQPLSSKKTDLKTLHPFPYSFLVHLKLSAINPSETSLLVPLVFRVEILHSALASRLIFYSKTRTGCMLF